ncbi:MAG: phosphoribosylglycinamide formyltransferase [Ectothiorhodospiraceae bacterium]|nr:phosphoribosylglycinamide formyltransferase [Ectothiorhodospiraceae bacterium]MCH8505612.1 phosphoribosylglycinamide formyltransferase [Ectothiorhodospiraceae bacterium]
MTPDCALVVLISGAGTNLQALMDADDLPVNIKAVISNRADAGGLERARRAGIPTRVLPHQDFESREAYDSALAELIDAYRPDLVVLAGFMRILSDRFVEHYTGRMLNIHPSLLPAFRGLHTHRRALEAGCAEHGCSVHFVTPDLDAGPVIVQARVAVSRDDSETTLAARVQQQEHRIYPLAVRWFAEGRLRLCENGILMDGKPMTQPVVV